jgi:tRNA(His) 5'-end guanylyltransferase|tara:strand:- start:112 stop:783 length:672 start_codon:yes stop_codon:yes gene_type:complete
MYSNQFKRHEQNYERLINGDLVVIRLDMENGKHVCKLHEQPYDSVFLDAVIDTFKAIVSFIPNVIAGYVISDEISLIWPSTTRWQSNRLLKICSISASYAGKELNNAYRSRAPLGSVYDSTLNTLYFDCRVFNLSRNEVLPYLQIRQDNNVFGNLHWKAKQIVEDRIVQQHKSEKSKRRLLLELNADFEEDPKRFSYGVLYTNSQGFNPEVGDFRQWKRLNLL